MPLTDEQIERLFRLLILAGITGQPCPVTHEELEAMLSEIVTRRKAAQEQTDGKMVTE